MIMLLRWIARIGGLVALVLGIMISRSPVLRLHMAIGLLVAVSLGILAIWAVAARVRIPAALAGVIWAIGTVRVGLMQTQWMPGEHHWVVQAAHAILGIGAIGFAEMLAAGLTKRSSPA